VQHQAADIDHVELTEDVRVELVDAQLVALDGRAERLAGDLEALAAALAGADGRDRLLGRLVGPVPLTFLQLFHGLVI
jgi:hypothetical protein